MMTIYQYLKFSSICIISLSLFACESEFGKQAHTFDNKLYYDLKGELEQQIVLLSQQNPEVEITARIGEKEESERVQKDSTAWAEALKLFMDADLNKAVLRDQYVVEDSTATDSGLQIKLYRAKDKSSVDIPFMEVSFEDSPEHVKAVKATFQEENLLYSTYRDMHLYFEKADEQLRLTEYVIQGKQKMILRDSVFYLTQGTLYY